jgi:hypothetical protein
MSITNYLLVSAYLILHFFRIVDKKIKDKMELIRALLWLFKKRLYNMRHKKKNSDGEYTLGIGREQYINPIKWQVYVPAFEIFGDDCVLNEKDFCYDFP